MDERNETALQMESERLNREFQIAALRTSLVSRLTGLSRSQLQQWHQTGFQEAHTRAGQRGVPRLYSWRDYHRLRVVAKLLSFEIPTERVRAAVRYMDELIPNWFTLTLRRYEGGAEGVAGRVHLAVPLGEFHVIPEAWGQLTFREQLSTEEGVALKCGVEKAISEMEAEGPLFLLSRFDDAVQMRPGLNAGLPTVIRSRLETSFIARLAAERSPAEVAAEYGLDERLVRRAQEFEEAA